MKTTEHWHELAAWDTPNSHMVVQQGSIHHETRITIQLDDPDIPPTVVRVGGPNILLDIARAIAVFANASHHADLK